MFSQPNLKQYCNYGGLSGATAPRGKSIGAYLGVSQSTTSPPAHCPDLLGTAASQVMHPYATESSEALPLLPGPSSQSFVRVAAIFWEVRGILFFLPWALSAVGSCYGPALKVGGRYHINHSEIHGRKVGYNCSNYDYTANVHINKHLQCVCVLDIHFWTVFSWAPAMERAYVVVSALSSEKASANQIRILFCLLP